MAGKKKQVLDIGAGLFPDKRATHVLDTYISQSEEKLYKSKGLRYAELSVYDVDKHKELKGKFDTIISNNAIGANPGLKRLSLGNKLSCLTKPKARVEILTGDLDAVPKIVKILKQGKFKIRKKKMPKTKRGSATIIATR